MTYDSVLAVTPTSDDWAEACIPVSTRLVEKHGGHDLAQTQEHSQIEGPDTPAALRIVIEWPSRRAAEGFMADPEYAPHLKARQNGSDSVRFLIESRDALV